MSTSPQIVAIPQLADNYGYLAMADGQAAAVDPVNADVMWQRCAERGARVTQIWATHHHPDHTAGIAAMLRISPQATLYMHPIDWDVLAGRDSAVAELARDRLALVGDGARLTLGSLHGQVIHNPGHTMGAISFFIPAQSHAKVPAVFTGDTLFGAGCGRRFEGTAEIFLASLMRLAALPLATAVYFGHEYTANNLRFAAAVEPHNEEILHRAEQVAQRLADGEFTTPSTVGIELATNPFLRCNEPSVRQRVSTHVGREPSTAADVFAILRAWKDTF